MSGAPADEMGCPELITLISDYLEGSLPFRNRLRFEAHLTRCRYCDAYLGALGELREESLSPQMREQVLEAFRGWAASRP